MESLKFSLVLKEIPVTLTDTSGMEQVLYMREMDGRRKGEYLNRMAKRMMMVDGKVKSITSFDGLESSLLTLCLYNTANEQVKEADIQTYPASVQTALFKAAQKLNSMDEESEAEAKND